MKRKVVVVEDDYTKMKWRCRNDIFGYCSGVPLWDIKPRKMETGGFIGGTCKLEPKTCGYYRTQGGSSKVEV